VRKGREVEPSGRVAESVVQVWWDGWQVSYFNDVMHEANQQDKSVEKLLGQLTSIFSATPPVFARPTAPPQTSSNIQASTSQPGPAYSPSPVQMGNPVSLPINASIDNQDQPPPPPARPFSGGGLSGTTPIATEVSSYLKNSAHLSLYRAISLNKLPHPTLSHINRSYSPLMAMVHYVKCPRLPFHIVRVQSHRI